MPTDFQPTEQLPHDDRTSVSRRAAGWASNAVRGLVERIGVKFGLVQSEEERSNFDTATSLYNMSGLMTYGDKLLADCEAHHRALSVAVFDFADIVEVRNIYGASTAREITGLIIEKLLTITGERGIAARTGLAEFAVVLPSMGEDKALAAIHRALGKPIRIEFESGDNEIVLVPGFALETSGPDMEDVYDLYREARLTIDEFQRNEQRHIEFVARQTERHSRPGALSAHTGHAAHAPTVPAALAA